jgi:hypothetical protein
MGQRDNRKNHSVREFRAWMSPVICPLSAGANAVDYGFAGGTSPTPTGIAAHRIRVRADPTGFSPPSGALAIAQQATCEFLTAARVSVSVKGYEVPPHFVCARAAHITRGGRI